jgi:hypothetical protein
MYCVCTQMRHYFRWSGYKTKLRNTSLKQGRPTFILRRPTAVIAEDSRVKITIFCILYLVKDCVIFPHSNTRLVVLLEETPHSTIYNNKGGHDSVVGIATFPVPNSHTQLTTQSRQATCLGSIKSSSGLQLDGGYFKPKHVAYLLCIVNCEWLFGKDIYN